MYKRRNLIGSFLLIILFLAGCAKEPLDIQTSGAGFYKGIASAAHVSGTSCGGVTFPNCGGEHPAFAVGAISCTADDSCTRNTARIGSLSCTAEDSCKFNKGNIGAGSCTAVNSCTRNTARIGDGFCTTDDSCRNNENDML